MHTYRHVYTCMYTYYVLYMDLCLRVCRCSAHWHAHFHSPTLADTCSLAASRSRCLLLSFSVALCPSLSRPIALSIHAAKRPASLRAKSAGPARIPSTLNNADIEAAQTQSRHTAARRVRLNAVARPSTSLLSSDIARAGPAPATFGLLSPPLS